ncbi:branched-chain-amino-acid aminotransferase, cytosolic-like isoform X1 [Bufo bufo]|uniref:branched-chain-amino-acid aminotransferase, cytosolic-like isoform X1 n=1 Tax=Bufo bufo TaxID=8384 RepID=UPI001ABEC92B|nr:branched-chain-amino-acid aminotransferase, cytosolic-like isoform X1 [Bufo bufo]
MANLAERRAAAAVHQNCKNGCESGKPGCDDHVPGAFKASDLTIELTDSPKEKPDPSKLVFGTVFSDHMLTVEWSAEKGWQTPAIKPLQNLSLHPACSVFNYAIELFEGLKAYRGEDGKIRLFRPQLNMERMFRSAKRLTLPLFDTKELLECIKKLIDVDREWVPKSTEASLYIRPVFMGTEASLGVKRSSKALLYVILSPVGPYFSSGAFNPISLWADPKYIRAWKGGTGDCKIGGNYGNSLFAQYEAQDYGCQQVLWLYGEDQQITEVGTMNLFLFWTNENGDQELVTPPLDGIILPGVTRRSILDLALKWREFKVSERHITMVDLLKALKEDRVKEMFGSGTACVVCPVGKILYKNENLEIPTMGNKLAGRILKELTDIQYGRTPSEWEVLVEDS